MQSSAWLLKEGSASAATQELLLQILYSYHLSDEGWTKQHLCCSRFIGLMQLDTVTIFSVPPVGGWAGTRPAPTFGAFPVGATLVVALATKGRNSQLYL